MAVVIVFKWDWRDNHAQHYSPFKIAFPLLLYYCLFPGASSKLRWEIRNDKWPKYAYIKMKIKQEAGSAIIAAKIQA